MICLFLGSQAQVWKIYDASVHPSNTGGGGDTLDLTSLSEDERGPNFVDTLLEDPEIPGNMLLHFYQPDDGKMMYRSYFDEEWTGTEFTIVARIKGSGVDSIDRAFDIQWRPANIGKRDELRIWTTDSLIELEKYDEKVKVNMNLNDWHIYRIVVIGDSSAIFVDENPVPVVAGKTTSSTSDNYIKVGDAMSSNTCGSYVDWLILTTSGAYSPGEGSLPSGLTGLYYPWLAYDGSVLPSETGSGNNTLDMTKLSQSAPGTNFMEEIILDSEIPGNKLLKYNQPEDAGTKMYRTDFDDDWTGNSYTLVARMRGSKVDTVDRLIDIQWRYGTRDELRVWPADSLVELEKVDIEFKVDYDLYDWHIYHIVVIGDSSAVYMDGNPDPVAYGPTTASTSDRYIKIGDGSSSNSCGGFLDWMILDTTGAYPPSEITYPVYLTGLTGEKTEWALYTARVLPDENDPPFKTSNIKNGDPSNQILVDPDYSGNKLLEFIDYPADKQGSWRTDFADDPQDIVTMVARVKGISDTLDRPMEFDFEHGGFRERLYIKSDNTYELKYSEMKGDLPNVMNWHTFRITKDTSFVMFYLDENPVPVAEVVTTQTSGNNYFRFGDGNGGTSVGGLIDWITWTTDGTYAPDELAVPDSLLTEFLSYDATLASLEADKGTLVPAFHPDSLIYDLIYPIGEDSVTLLAGPNHPKATVTGDSLFAIVPDTAHIIVTAEDLSTLEYIVYLKEYVPSSDATLSALTPSVGTLVPDFDPDTTMYSLGVPSTTDSIVFTAVTNDALATVEGDTVFKEIGDTAVITVTAEDGITVVNYSVVTKVILSSDATLSGLSVSTGILEPAFHADTLEYSLEVPAGENSVTITATPNDTLASVTGDGEFNTFPSTAVITVTAEDGSTLDYTVYITRYTPSSDATLSALSVNIGTLVPDFDEAITSYTLEVPEGTTSITITATANHDSATVSGDGAFTTIPGTATVTVTAEDGTTNDYTIEVSVEVGISKQSESIFTFYPNPAGEWINIHLNINNAEICIYNLLGERVLEMIANEPVVRLNTSRLSSGVYFIKVRSDLEILTRQIIIE